MEIRINKLLSTIGVCSRREADRLTEAGRVTADGEVVQTGQKVDEGAYICIDGKPVKRNEKKVLLAYNKPKGVVCTTTDRFNERDIISEIGFDVRIYPIGRLDKESTGLILLTNIGEIANKLTDAGEEHEKEYVVKINKPVTDDFLKKMRSGVYLKELDKTTAPCMAEAEYFGDRSGGVTHFFRIILIQGLNRQIRRMCEACGARVRELKRVRINNVVLGDLDEGEYRLVEGEELSTLRRTLQG